MNAFLEKHGIEVGKVASILLWSAAIDRLIAMVFSIAIHGTITIRLDALIAAYLAIELWEKKNWARVATLVTIWVALIGVFIGMGALPFMNVKQVAIIGQPYSLGLYIRIWVVVVLCAPISVFCILALNAEKTKREFNHNESTRAARSDSPTVS